MYIPLLSMLVLCIFSHPAEGGTARLYNSQDCSEATRGPECTNLPELRCCISANGFYYESARVYGDSDIYIAVAAYNSGGTCQQARSTFGSSCLTTYARDIYGAFWFNCLRECRRASRDLAPGNSNSTIGEATANAPACQGVQYADVYHVAAPGEESKPYSAEVIELLNEAKTIDWATNSFKTEAMDTVNAIVDTHGHGLSETQLAAVQRK